MPTEGSSQFDSLWDSCAAFVLNAYYGYGWLVPALLLTLLFFALVAVVCWALEDIDLELPLFEGPGAIFRWSKENWQLQRGPLTLSIVPSRSSPSAQPPSSARE